MKETFFYTVSVLLVFVAFAVFPMNLEADPGGDEKEYEMTRLSYDESGIINTIQSIQKPKHILLTFEDCKDNTSCVSEKSLVPRGQVLSIRNISISAGIKKPIDRLHKPLATLVIMPDPEGPCYPIRLGAMKFSCAFWDGDEITLGDGDGKIFINLSPGTEFYIMIQTNPNHLSLEYKMQAIVSGFVVPDKY